MPVKLIALDVDGTLLNDDLNITERTKNAIIKAKESGAKVVLATGRNPTSCYHIVEELNLQEHLITHNGAVIVDLPARSASFELGFKVEEIIPILDYCRKHRLHFDLNTAFDMYIEHINPIVADMYDKFLIHPILSECIENVKDVIVKVSIFAEEALLDQVFEEVSSLCPQWRIIRSGEEFIDIIHPKVTKGFALSHLLKKYNILPKETIAFGNYFNDLEMIQLAGIGVAMDNAPAEVKALANRVTKSNNEDGVAHILEEMFHIH